MSYMSYICIVQCSCLGTPISPTHGSTHACTRTCTATRYVIEDKKAMPWKRVLICGVIRFASRPLFGLMKHVCRLYSVLAELAKGVGYGFLGVLDADCVSSACC